MTIINKRCGAATPYYAHQMVPRQTDFSDNSVATWLCTRATKFIALSIVQSAVTNGHCGSTGHHVIQWLTPIIHNKQVSCPVHATLTIVTARLKDTPRLQHTACMLNCGSSDESLARVTNDDAKKIELMQQLEMLWQMLTC